MELAKGGSPEFLNLLFMHFDLFPLQRARTPELVPEDVEPIWSRGAQSVLSKSIGIKQRMRNIISGIYDYLGDPRIGPILLLGALMSFGTIWLMRSQPTNPSQSSQPSQPTTNASDISLLCSSNFSIIRETKYLHIAYMN